jgi:hypothetical protein
MPTLLVVALTLVTMVVLFTFDPATTWWFPSCPFYMMTGFKCPLCGSLRALHALLRGAPLVAFSFNPLVTVSFAGTLSVVVRDIFRPAHVSARERLTDLCFSARGIALVATFGVLRNLLDVTGWIVR